MPRTWSRGTNTVWFRSECLTTPVVAADLLDHDAQLAADELLVGAERVLLLPLDPAGEALDFDLARHDLEVVVSGRARARGVDERVRLLVADLVLKREGLPEVLLRLAREADDDVGRDDHALDLGAYLTHDLEVARTAQVLSSTSSAPCGSSTSMCPPATSLEAMVWVSYSFIWHP